MEKQAVLRDSTHVFLSQNGQFCIHAKNQGNSICSFQKNAENLRFWGFLTILAQNGQFWTYAAQNVQLSSFPEKNKNVTFLHSLRLEFMHKIREIECAVFQKNDYTSDTERETDRDETVFNGPNYPFSVKIKI